MRRRETRRLAAELAARLDGAGPVGRILAVLERRGEEEPRPRRHRPAMAARATSRASAS